MGLCDQRRAILFKPQFEDAYDFVEGIAASQKSDKWGYVTKEEGRFFLSPNLRTPKTLPTFRGYRPSHRLKNSKTGIIDKQGLLVPSHSGRLTLALRKHHCPLRQWAPRPALRQRTQLHPLRIRRNRWCQGRMGSGHEKQQMGLGRSQRQNHDPLPLRCGYAF